MRITIFLFAYLICGSAVSAELGAVAPAPPNYVSQHHHFSLPPEKHVLEVVNFSSFGLQFLINGHYFLADPLNCPGWVAGDRVMLLSGEWHGYCTFAVFSNRTRHRTCQVSCGSWSGFNWR
jgi:hypothetical protein